MQIFSVIAEFERDITSFRTKKALRVLKERGIKLGRIKGTFNKRTMYDEHRKKIEQWCKLGFPVPAQARAIGRSPSGLYRSIKTRGIYKHKYVIVR